MSRGSYHGGSTIIGPGGRFWRSNAGDGDAPKKVDAEMQAIMAEHDWLRALGINPMSKSKRRARKAKR